LRARLRTIGSRLFLWYSLVIVAVIVLFVLSFSYYSSRLLRERASRSSIQLTQTVLTHIDAEIATMNEVSVNVAFSSATFDTFLRYFAETDSVERATLRRSLSNLLFGFIGPLQPVSQLNLYDLEGRDVGVGFSNGSSDRPLPPAWFSAARALRGAKHVTAPQPDAAARSSGLAMWTRSHT
jgi:hypothetical protein